MQRSRHPRAVLPAFVTAIGLILLVALGGWQVSRHFEKRDLIDRIEARGNLPASDLPAPARWQKLDIDAWRLRPVKSTGRFLHDREIHLFTHLPRVRGTRRFAGPGFWIITPFKTADATVLVNRGFVPQQLKQPARRKQGQVAGMRSIRGIVRGSGRAGLFAPANEPDENRWYVRDIAAMARHLGIEPAPPFLIAYAGPAPPGGLPQPPTARPRVTNPHLNYAVTWFALALCLLAVYALYRRRGSAST